jgi:hypothetical protein
MVMTKKCYSYRIITKKYAKVVVQFLRILRRTTKNLIRLFLKIILKSQRRRNLKNQGFVLPTTTMVILVVMLLTMAIVFRSFERAKHAHNTKINQTVINAATPAIDRGKAKINQMLADPRITQFLPSDQDLYNNLINYLDEYTFGDETNLTLNLQNYEPLKTAWKFPVDTNNNGKFDSYTLYGIYFKNPPQSNQQYVRARNTLEARSLPINPIDFNSRCQDFTSISKNLEKLVDTNGWLIIGGQMRKAFFVYTATVPITSQMTIPTQNQINYEISPENKAFYALEYKQERIQIPSSNNAIVYEDDLQITGNEDFRINGRIFTNSNLLTGSASRSIRLYQISSQSSCFYEPENSKIIVGGNLAAGGFTDNKDLSTATTVDLFKDKGVNPQTIAGYNPRITDHKSVTNSPQNIAYNSLAYMKRINKLVDRQMANYLTTDPQEVKQGIIKKQKQLGTAYTTDQYDQIRRKELELYFQKRTRRVPFQEVPFGSEQSDVNKIDNPLQSTGDTLRPIDPWIYPFASDGITGTSHSQLSLNISGNLLKPSATEPMDQLQKQLGGVEQYLGDRVIVGHNLPQMWWNYPQNRFFSTDINHTQNLKDINWDLGNEPRTRYTTLHNLAGLAAIERDGDWEYAAAQVPENPQQENFIGGLRVVTGSGIYLPRNHNASSTNFLDVSTKIWSDILPIPQTSTEYVNTTINPYWMYDSSLGFTLPKLSEMDITTPYLKMRATVVYHYKSSNYHQNNPTPIACISSFYLPTNSNTATNMITLPNAVGIEKSMRGVSNNGIVYPPPTRNINAYANLLTYQAQLQYPNGRWVNEPLRNALAKNNYTLSEKSAIDTALCALQIMDGSISPLSNPPIPHGAIKEIAFLDSREIRANQTSNQVQMDSNLPYDLPLRDRQPLEIRATVIDLNQLRTTRISTDEYLLPNSGIIYATRDDALPDISGGISAKSESSVDYKLDPTRRPNGILITTSDSSPTKLFRSTSNTFRREEKGLILASNLPVYIKGDFNRHTQEEFTSTLAADWSNFYNRSQINHQFACRPSDSKLPNCTVGDEWRNAAILADSITLLSQNFRFGFRNEGDYDWNNYIGDTASFNNRPTNFEYNTYAPTITQNYDINGIPNIDLDPVTNGIQGSSYFHNFVTPIVKQIPAREFLLEVCLVSNTDICNSDPTQWVISRFSRSEYNGQPESNIEGLPITAIKTGSLDYHHQPSNGWENLPQRIAFKRNMATGKLLQPLSVYGVDNNQIIRTFSFSGNTLPKLAVNQNNQGFLIPWLTPDSNGFWQPVLQINQPFATPTDPHNTNSITNGSHNHWLQIATPTTVNFIAATGDNPARPMEDNGGLPNLLRLLENWSPNTTPIDLRINGAFIQMKRSNYATGTYSTSINSQPQDFQYKIAVNSGRSSGHLPPRRQWHYDVALLSQPLDLFTQKIPIKSQKLSKDYFRQVGRNDEWIQTLLCAKQTSDGTYAIDQDQRFNCY